MSSTVLNKNDKKYMPIIGVLSVAIPLAVAFLLFMPQTGSLGDLDVSFLPSLNAILNTTAAILLISGLVAIKNNRPDIHKTLMMSAFVLSSLFLVSYVIYHTQAESTKFGDVNHNGIVEEAELAAVGMMRIIYLVVLLSHIAFSTVVVPLVLMAIYFAISGQLPRHKKIVKWAYPIWLYVAITGPIVYLMISPYYNH